MYYLPLLAAEKVLTGTEQMSGGQIAAMTVVGLLVVFSALLILVAFLYCSGGVFKTVGGKPKAKKQPAAPQKTAAPVQKPAAEPAKASGTKPAAPPVQPDEDESEIVAVIMAAVAAMGAAEGKTYALKSVRQVGGRGDARSIWAQAGRSSQTRPF